MTVTGTSAPSSANTWVIPTFLPIIPSIAISVHLGTESLRFMWCRVRGTFSSFSKGLDLHVHTRGKLELHERVDGLRRRLENVEQALVRPHLELFARLFVHMRTAQDGVARHLRRKRNRSRHSCPGTLG